MSDKVKLEDPRCDFCMWVTDHLFHAKAWGAPPRDGWICAVCHNTYAGNAFLYPEQFAEKESMRMLAWGINFLAADPAVRKAILEGTKRE